MKSFNFGGVAMVQYEFAQYLSDSDSPPPTGAWLLTTGFWDDTGEYIDAETWVD